MPFPIKVSIVDTSMKNIKQYLIPIILGAVVLVLIGLIVKEQTRFTTNTNHAEDVTMEDHGDPHTTESTETYAVDLLSSPKDIKTGALTRITYKIKNDKEETVKNFQVVHESIMHLIVVRKDLQDFQHLHPTFNSATGEFTIDISFNKPGPYRLYADFTPATFEDNPESKPSVAVFDISIGDVKKYKAQVVSATQEQAQKVDGYDITYSVEPFESRTTQKDVTYTLNISKNGKPVTTLQPYLGEIGHSVLINAKTLEYYHTHAGTPTTDKKGPEIPFTAFLSESGTYKAFSQFKHDEKVITSEYVFELK